MLHTRIAASLSLAIVLVVLYEVEWVVQITKGEMWSKRVLVMFLRSLVTKVKVVGGQTTKPLVGGAGWSVMRHRTDKLAQIVKYLSTALEMMYSWTLTADSDRHLLSKAMGGTLNYHLYVLCSNCDQFLRIARSTDTCLSTILRLVPPIDSRRSTLASKSKTSWISGEKFLFRLWKSVRVSSLS